MAYNFESTFTQPLIADFDSGKIGNAKAMAEAITNKYINTIKMGMPIGVPPVLPAPGLNPTTPPPFTIGASGFSTAASRKSAMYSVLHAYFAAKELSIQKSSIKDMIATSGQIVKKIKAANKRVKTLIQQYEQARKALSEIPTLTADIKRGVKELLAKPLRELKDLENSIETGHLSANMDATQFRALFENEHRVINKLKQFDISDIGGVLLLTNYISSESSNVNTTTRLQQTVKRRLVSIAKNALSYVQIPINPSRFIDFANSVSNTNTQLTRFAAAIMRLDFMIRFVRPKLLRIKAKISTLLTKIRDKMQAKLQQLQQRLTKRLADFAQRKADSKRAGLYSKASRIIKREKRGNTQITRKITSRVKALTKLLKQLGLISTKVIALSVALKGEFEVIGVELKKRRKLIKNIELEQSTVRTYFSRMGEPALMQQALRVLMESGSSASDLIKLFEQRKVRLRMYGLEIQQLGDEVLQIQQLISALFGAKASKKKSSSHKSWVSQRISSLRALFQRVYDYIKPKLAKIGKWLNEQVLRLRSYLKNKVQKYAAALEKFALNLLPLNSNVQDSTNKKAILDAKRQEWRHAKDSIANFYKKLKLLQTAIPGVVGLTNNLNSGKLRLSDNEANISKVVHGIFAYRKHGKSKDAQHGLSKQETAFRGNFDTLLIVEVLLNTLASIGKALKAGEASNQKALLLSDLKKISKESSEGGQASYQVLEQLFNTPPSNLSEIKALGEKASSASLMDSRVLNRVVAFEKRTLSRVRQGLISVLEVGDLKSKHTQLKQSGQTAGLFFVAYAELEKIVKALGKQSSLVLALVKLVGKLITKLMQWLKTQVGKLLSTLKTALQNKLAKRSKQARKDAAQRVKRKPNKDALGMTIALGIAARAFWTGATWQGPTQSMHTTALIGTFSPTMKAQTEGGASNMFKEMARGFEMQLASMQGFVIPLANTGIAPIPFSGYR